jgi:2-(1,2-epoxy-1,2-dihydrophenyl)acetyl-CoA isomerase
MAEGRAADLTLEERAHGLRERMEVSRRLHEMPRPTLAMVRGAAAGAGLALALACDLRIAFDTVKLGTAFARVGYSGDFGGSYFLTKLVGTARARELYFTAEQLGAERGSPSGSSTGSCRTPSSRRRHWRSPRGSPGGRAWPAGRPRPGRVDPEPPRSTIW